MAAITWPSTSKTPPHGVYRRSFTTSDFDTLDLDQIRWATTLYITAPSGSDVHYVPAGNDEANYTVVKAGTSVPFPLARQGSKFGVGPTDRNAGATVKIKAASPTVTICIEALASVGT